MVQEPVQGIGNVLLDLLRDMDMDMEEDTSSDIVSVPVPAACTRKICESQTHVWHTNKATSMNARFLTNIHRLVWEWSRSVNVMMKERLWWSVVQIGTYRLLFLFFLT